MVQAHLFPPNNKEDAARLSSLLFREALVDHSALAVVVRILAAERVELARKRQGAEY